MTDLLKQLPEEIVQLIERCQAHVKKRFDLELDFTSDTLSVLDYFVEELVKDEYQGQIPPPGHQARMNMVHLFSPTLAAYFTAVLIDHFGGKLRHTEKSVKDWRFEFGGFFMRFNPVGVAANVLAKQQVEGLSSVLWTSSKLMPKLTERFEVAPDVLDEDFFSFCTVFESIQIAEEFLCGVAKKDGATDCSSPHYDLLLGDK